jgi:hypothetical protein
MIEYVSEFNSVVTRLESMEVSLHEELKIAILLRGLPSDFSMFVSALKHREKVPPAPLEQVIGMLCAEDQGRKAEGYVGEQKCPECNKPGHSSASCWELHPDIAPVCRNCNKRGHIAKSCRRPRRGSAEVADANGSSFAIVGGHDHEEL